MSATYEPHPAAELFPMMGESELRGLSDDIKANGQRVPIVLHEGKILDGRNRARACELAGIEPRTEEWRGEGSPIALVISANLHRRHLTPSQQAMIAADAKVLFELEARGRMEEGRNQHSSPRANLPEGDRGRARDKAAALCGVSPRTVESASKVLAHGAPALIAAVKAGDVAVSTAAAVAELPHEEQERAVAAGPKAVKRAASPKPIKSKELPVPVSKPTPEQDQDRRARIFTKHLVEAVELKDSKQVHSLLRTAIGCLNAPAREERKLWSEFEDLLFKYRIG